jgi:hypothetical protein
VCDVCATPPVSPRTLPALYLSSLTRVLLHPAPLFISLFLSQLVGITAMFMASKQEEVPPQNVLYVGDCVYVCDGAYTSKQVIDMEKQMLDTLG